MQAALSRVPRLVAVLSGSVLALGALTATASAATSPVLPIGPNQFFTGDVNGASSDAIIATRCVGPLGHPVGGYVQVNEGPSPDPAVVVGYTGSTADSVTAILATTTGTSGVIGTLHYYGVQLALPLTLNVPCSGTGVVSFVPAPDLLHNGRPATVTVRFIPIP